MNIWSLDKQNTIRQLLLRLEKHFGKGTFHLVEPEHTNQLSARIAPADMSMTLYIYCYGQKPGHYGLHLEYPSVDGTQDEEIYEELPIHRLIDVLSLYL